MVTTVLSQIFLTLICLIVFYLAVRLIFQAYFAARAEYVNSMVEKAKELMAHGKK